MIAPDSLQVAVHLMEPSDVPSRWLSACHRACSASASALPSHVQASCLERAQPAAITAFAGGLAASSTAPPGRRGPERQGREKAEGKTKGGGTWPSAKPVCTWGWCGTMRHRRRAVWSAKPAPTLICPRASHGRARHSLLGTWP
ncbi:hypothetical protein F0A16_21510 [Salinicola corii]|uniref:Uncharacterized protein n=1 Tax=Salinicola corii TaxID=2606937 RepID=A0A640W711_9GAMM|nr:hypothetical protein F0A16_21510 [Salinicola corii]